LKIIKKAVDEGNNTESPKAEEKAIQISDETTPV